MLTGGAGADTFQGTKDGLNGDTIADFITGAKIVLTDAMLADFPFNLSGSTLNYPGGSLTFGSTLTGQLIARGAAGGAS